MDLMNLSELAKATGRHKTTLKRYHERGEIPHPEHPNLGDGTGKVYGQAAIDFVAGIRKNQSRTPAEPVAPTEFDEHLEKVETGAFRAAREASLGFVRVELELAQTEGKWKLEAALHRRIADMIEELHKDDSPA